MVMRFRCKFLPLLALGCVALPVRADGPGRDPVKAAAAIDQAIAKKVATDKIVPSARASDAEFLRRAYLDITGVVPTAAQARAFLDSTDPARRAKLIDELLASPNYGRHFGLLWCNLVTPRDANMIR